MNHEDPIIAGSPMADLVVGNVKKAMKDAAVGRIDLYMARVDSIRKRPGFNAAREADPDHATHIRMLADSIKANGFMRHKPLTVAAGADGVLYLSDGHSRYDTALLAISEGAQIEALPVVNEVAGTTETDRVVGLVTNNNGRPLTPYGEALVCKELLSRGIDEKEVARRTGFTLAKVSSLLVLLSAPAEIVSMVTAGELSATQAIATIRTDGAEAVATLKAAKKAAVAKGKRKVTKKDIAPRKVGKPARDLPSAEDLAAIAEISFVDARDALEAILNWRAAQ